MLTRTAKRLHDDYPRVHCLHTILSRVSRIRKPDALGCNAELLGKELAISRVINELRDVTPDGQRGYGAKPGGRDVSQYYV